MDVTAITSMKKHEYKMSKKQEKALKKLLDQEHDRFNAMDIDEDGKVYWLEFKEYWRQYMLDNYGYDAVEGAEEQYKVAFEQIAGDKKYFTWKMYKKFLTEIELDIEDEEEK